ncbi:MAG: hypothetical protein R3Y52_01800 [Psittacicella sp.]
MLSDLNNLASKLEVDKNIKVVVFESANPEFFITHYDIDILKDMSTEPILRQDVKLLDPQVVLERISKLP